MSNSMQIGSWSMQNIPSGWEILSGYGLRQVGENVFPSVLILSEESLPQDLTLSGYVSNQIEAIKVLLNQPKIKGPTPAAMPVASEAQRLGISYQTEDGRSVIQIQIYAVDASQVGNVTFTTLEQELPRVGVTVQNMIRGLRFQVGAAGGAG